MIPATSTPQQRANFMDTVSASSWSRCTARKKQPFSNVIFDVCFLSGLFILPVAVAQVL